MLHEQPSAEERTEEGPAGLNSPRTSGRTGVSPTATTTQTRETSTGHNPLRERGVALLMSALHDEGRTHDAHAVYARLVHRLGEGLAVGPGREVRRTLDAILDGASPVPGTRVDALSDTGTGARS
ncbi:BTAD domain-containing putative transcriptional regulator [Streptomyces tibetensis]|uniref:BTAD domain-containing putative transcriptional regulator n=1 Tax=Streptomyces tibetensis TaxID=2382123 RepID=UPI00382AE00C